MTKWDGKTKGSLLGYKFFVFCIRTFGLRIAYFFCLNVSVHFILVAKKQRHGLMQFYRDGFGFSGWKAFRMAVSCFNRFGQTLVDRIAVQTRHRKRFTHTFINETALLETAANGQGGILLSGHVGNWEIAGNLIRERITSSINIVMLDAEVEKVKEFLKSKTGGPGYNLIPIKDDLSHLILIHAALKRKELVAIHADRVSESGKVIVKDFLGKPAAFPAGPFILASKFKVPVFMVYGVKTTARHYELSAKEIILGSEEEIAAQYVDHLETMVRKYPDQWFNFYNYYAD